MGSEMLTRGKQNMLITYHISLACEYMGPVEQNALFRVAGRGFIVHGVRQFFRFTVTPALTHGLLSNDFADN